MFALWCTEGCCDSGRMDEEEEARERLQLAMSDDAKSSQKITGYLEKRGKLKLMNSWKRYWFVLEGHLLLYYGSKEDYDALSPCKGSITLGPTCNVKPYASTPSKFQITTRSGCVTTLRAESISEQNRWMQAIFSSVNENQKVDISPTKLCHFRYSTERVDMLMNNTDQKSSNSPIPPEPDPSPPRTLENDENQLLERLQRMGARSYCDSIVSNHQKIVNKHPKPKQLDMTFKARFYNETMKDTAPVSPRKLQFSPRVTKITEEPSLKDVILEDEDYCVCTLEKSEDKEDPKTSMDNHHRSISFSEAREVFNRNQNTTVEDERSSVLKKIEKKLIKIEKDKTIKSEDTKQIRTSDQKMEEKSVEVDAEKDDEDKEKEEHKQNDENIQSLEDNSGHTLTKNEKHPSQISLLGAYYNSENDQETPPSYQDFRENELYAIQQKIDSSDEDYAEPKFLEEAKTRDQIPDFQFPPPPFEAYESIDDLTKNDNDSLYEEAEDFVWQNEIYESVSQEPSSRNQNLPDSLNKTEGLIESEDELYEEVDINFVSKRNMDTRGNEDLYTEPGFHENRVTECVETDDEMYEIVDVSHAKSPRDENRDAAIEMENELYGEINKNDPRKRDQNQDSKTSKNERCENTPGNIEIENDLYEAPKELLSKSHMNKNINRSIGTKEIQIENEIYAKSSQSPPRDKSVEIDKRSSEVQMDNEIYAVPNINSIKDLRNNVDQTCLDPSPKSKSSFRKDSQSEHMDKQSHKNIFERIQDKNRSSTDKTKEEKQITNELYGTVEENEIYSEPNSVQCRERTSSNTDSELNFYEDPDELILRSPKIEKKKKLHKSEELKKQDNFIQRLLKQVTRKHVEKNDKGVDADETLKLLGDIQVLLEKKKKMIKEMVATNSKPSHRRILSETNAQVKKKDGATPLLRTFSIDVNDEYSVVRDYLEDDNEAIYSEVEIMDRSSKELNDLIEDLLKQFKDTKEGCDSQSTA